MTLGLIQNSSDPLTQTIESFRFTFYIDLFIILGFISGLTVVSKLDIIRTQTLGFFICAAGLTVTLLGYLYQASAGIILSGFLLFELALNAGPHLSTFELPSRIYSLEERAGGEGVASALGKLGAIIATFIIPLLLKAGGGTLVLAVAIAVLLTGGVITILTGPKVINRKE